MAINNNPTIEPRTITGIFTRYITKTIPLAFDESMSYYECLCALLNYLNETIVPDINNVNDGLEELQNYYLELQNYVNTYFDNLDVQEEINNKLDEMVEDGTFNTILGNYINPYLTSFNGRLDEQDAKIDSLASGSPLVASSTSGMTDTTKTYVNTTNGKWYYYNGEEWTIGGTYQASEDSNTVDTLSKLAPKMIKLIQNNNIIMTKDTDNFTVSLQLNRATYIYTENRWLNLSYIQPVVFSLSDYNINSGTWALIIRNNTFNLIQLANNINNLTEQIGDLILCIIRPSDIVTLIPDRIRYNNIEIGYASKYREYYKDCYLNRRINIDIDTDNSTITITNPSNVDCACYVGRYIVTIPGNKTNTYSFDNFLDTSLGNVLSILFNKETGNFEIGQSPKIEDARGNYTNNLFKQSYSTVLIALYNIATNVLVPFTKNNLYLNNELITFDKVENDVNDLKTKINLLDYQSYDFLRCFKNFTFIGDSLSAGYTSVDGHTISSATAKAQNNNWPSYLCSRLNRTFTNLAVGSSTIHNWRYADQQGQTETDIENADIDTGIYFVSLGVNDLRQSLSVGTSADIDTNDYTQNEDTVYGNYDYIINKLKSFNPHAKIFTFTIPNSENNPTNINNAIKYVSNLYDNVYCIDLYSLYDFSTGFIHANLSSGHYNPITYNYISTLIESAVNNYIYNNYTDFDLVPYDYD